ncbi:hypothetical protein QRD43_20405 [Pelomonas sp. APW6]|uniref:Uncharacterized protein n=1 Tax=Roseateles subflavus TaxID=3053353 RepID=A0ABT7LRC2_9BURK|nr:hypothetical protein [Pelomonas sp. APW6]MDL5034275.1 hypothetical protein [Pelomonas sp. APW6]
MPDTLHTLGHFRCTSCGHIAVGISRQTAEQLVEEANAFAAATGDKRRHETSRYLSCQGCSAPAAAFVAADPAEAAATAELAYLVVPDGAQAAD